MKEEYEVKFLDIEVLKIEAKLKEIGAKKLFDRHYRWRNYDYPDLKLNTEKAWFKIRDEGDKVTMNFKKRLGHQDDEGKTNDQGMEEYTVEVSDFEGTCRILEKIGLIVKFYEEKHRIRYQKENIYFDIDTQPGIPTFLEIEADSWEGVDQGIRLLELNPKDKRIISAYQIYKMHGIEMLDYKEFSFKKGLIKK